MSTSINSYLNQKASFLVHAAVATAAAGTKAAPCDTVRLQHAALRRRPHAASFLTTPTPSGSCHGDWCMRTRLIREEHDGLLDATLLLVVAALWCRRLL